MNFQNPIDRANASIGDAWKGFKIGAAFLAAAVFQGCANDAPGPERSGEPATPAVGPLEPGVSANPLADASFSGRELAQRSSTRPLPYIDGRYHTSEEFRQEAEKLVKEFPNLAAIEELGRSVENRPIWRLKISDNVAREEQEPKTAYIAGIHGDERAQPEMLLAFSRYLLMNYATDARVREIVDQSSISIVICANPDGWEAATRRNHNDVDLNRDFPSIHAGRRLARGDRQPETLALMKLFEREPFGLIIDFHATSSAGGVIFVNTPYDNEPAEDPRQRFPDYQLALNIAHAYADAHPVMRNIDNEYLCQGVTVGGGASWFQAPTGPDCACEHYDTTALTVELSNPKNTPADQLQKHFDDNLKSMLVCLEAARSGFHLEIVDENGQAIRDATVTVSSSQRNLSFEDNKLHRLAPPGKHEVIISRWGYERQVLWAESKPFDGEYTKVVLRRAS